jgi:hypothetical protein
VETPDGVGNITSVDYLRETVKVRLEDAPDAIQTYAGDELNVIRSGKGRRPEGYVAPPRAELEKLRKVTPPPVAPEKPDLTGSIDSALSQIDGEGRRDRRRNDRSRQENRPRQEKPKGENRPKSGNKPQQEAKPAGGEGQNQKSGSSRNRRRRYRGGKPKNTGGAE